jgi:hypothetical protein
MREYRFVFTIECASQGRADMGRVEQLIDLAMQDLVHDDHFTAALGEKESVTIQVLPVAKLD